jgi:hypothetical protein
MLGTSIQAGDAYAAHEILRHPALPAGERSRRELKAIVRDGGLGQGALPESVLSTMMQAVSTAGASLVHCLAEEGAAVPYSRRPGTS